MSNTNYDQQVKDAQTALDNAKNAQRNQKQTDNESSTPIKVHVGLVDALIAFFTEHKQQFINLPALVTTCEDIISELEGAKSDAKGVDTTTSPSQDYQPSYTPTGVAEKPNYVTPGTQGPDYNRYGVGSPSTNATSSTSGTNGGGTGVGAPFESNTAGTSSFDGNTNVGGPSI